MENIVESYCNFTADLLLSKRTFGTLHRFTTAGCDQLISVMEHQYNEVFCDKTLPKYGHYLSFGTWLIESVFPRVLYKQNDSNLMMMLHDDRFFDPPGTFHNKQTYHNFLGRMARPRDVACSKYIGFLDYLLDRWERDNHKSMPHFYFPIEDPIWVFEELMRNPNQIKSGRTAVSCVMNICFRWDPVAKQPVISIILKHTQWHHTIGDFCGGALIIMAIAKELGLDPTNCVVNIFLPSASLDYPKEAKTALATLYGKSRIRP